jgi:predicted RNase H-like nuclease (RuvC/YqgF family)
MDINQVNQMEHLIRQMEIRAQANQNMIKTLEKKVDKLEAEHKDLIYRYNSNVDDMIELLTKLQEYRERLTPKTT